MGRGFTRIFAGGGWILLRLGCVNGTRIYTDLTDFCGWGLDSIEVGVCEWDADLGGFTRI